MQWVVFILVGSAIVVLYAVFVTRFNNQFLKEDPMGGSNETTLPGKARLRMHEVSGDVHVHDDKNKLKLCMPIKKFKKEYEAVKKKLTAHNPTEFEGEITDKSGVTLTAERDGDEVEWRLDVEPVEVGGFDEVDGFLGI